MTKNGNFTFIHFFIVLPVISEKIEQQLHHALNKAEILRIGQ